MKGSKKKFGNAYTILAFAPILTIALPAHAATVEVNFSGITTLSTSGTGVPVGAPIIGVIRYVSEATDSNPNPDEGYYNGIARIVTLSINGENVPLTPNLTFPQNNRIVVVNQAARDIIGADTMFFTASTFNDWRPFGISYTLSDSTDNVVTDTQLPSTFSMTNFNGLAVDCFQCVNQGRINFEQNGFSNQLTMWFSLVSLEADLIGDTDEDGFTDDVDNCPTVSNADQADGNNNGVGDSCDELTPEGSGVSVSPDFTLPDGTSTTTVDLTFSTVTTAGSTTVTTASTPICGASGSPTGFEIGTPPVYFDVITTAEFNGSVALCISWQEGQFDDEDSIKLFHFEGGAWLDVTTSLNTFVNKVCGQVTTLSPFAAFESSFAGFFAPVDNPPTRNSVKAGAAVPVKFSLGGNRGLAIFNPGFPVSQSVTCDSGTPIDSIEETLAAGGNSLTYEASSDRYTYVWKTDKAWAKSCRRLLLKLNSGLLSTAEFVFIK